MSGGARHPARTKQCPDFKSKCWDMIELSAKKMIKHKLKDLICVKLELSKLCEFCIKSCAERRKMTAVD